MMKAFENLIKAILRTTLQSRFFKWLNNYAAPKKEKVAPLTDMPEEQNAEPLMEPEPDKPLIALDEPAVLVACISCGTIHKLSALCQNCHMPVCTDGFCRRSVYKEDLDANVIHCRSCSSQQQSS